MSTATVTTKGQVTIPADIRAAYDIAAGDRLVFYRTLGGDLNVHVKKRIAGGGRGALRAPGRRVSVDEMNEAIEREGGAEAAE